MITSEQFERLIRGLIMKTKEGKVEWKQDDENRFGLLLPHSRMSLEYVSPPAEVDFIRLELYGPKGALAASWKCEEGEKQWDQARELYSEVHKVVTGFDEILQDLEPFIKG